ncbi:hypothetical protein BKA69DRAFT_503207 [Paraphysoderma sedebokerense]|nr:hypothetical protein BKA69DRAFT_503207 [Paraphysoderma sedebokerense]
MMLRLRVDDKYRSQFEREQNVTILQWLNEKLEVSRKKDTYFPTTLIHQYDSLSQFIGYDPFNQEPVRTDAITKMQQTGLPTLSRQLLLPTGRPGLILYRPLNITNKYVDSSIPFNLTGFVSAMFDVNQMFRHSFAKSGQSHNLKLSVYDRTPDASDPSGRLIFQSDNGTLPSEGSLSPSSLLAASDEIESSLHDTSYADNLQFTSTLNAVDRIYELTCIPSDELVKSHLTSLPYIILGISLFASLLLAILVFILVMKYNQMKKERTEKHHQLQESQKLVDSLSRYSEAIVKALPDPLLYVKNGFIKGANEPFLKATGYHVGDIVNPVTPTSISTVIQSLSTTHPDLDLSGSATPLHINDVFITRIDGTTFTADVSISEPFNESTSSNERCQVILMKDSTEKKETLVALSNAKTEAQRAHDAKTEILYFLCHEIRNPVHVILGMTDIIQNETGSRSSYAEYFNGITTAAEFLGSMVDDVLSLLDFHVQSNQVVTSPISLIQFLHDFDTDYSNRASQNGVKFTLEIDLNRDNESPHDSRNEMIMTDPNLLRNCLSKLVEYCINVTPQDGEVMVSVHSTHSTQTYSPSSSPGATSVPSVALSSSTNGNIQKSLSQYTIFPRYYRCYRFIIKDTSPASINSEITKLFDPFNAYHSASQGHQFGGIGLSFALARHFAEVMGGTVQIKPLTERKHGNEFWVDLTFESLEENGMVVENPIVDRSKMIGNGSGPRRFKNLGMSNHFRPMSTVNESPLDEAHVVDQFEIPTRNIDDDSITHAADFDSPTITDSGHPSTSSISKPGSSSSSPMVHFSEQRAQIESPTFIETQNHPAKVLLVEDNAVVRKVTTKLLERSGFEVVTADNGLQALQQIESGEVVDVVLMDLVMPVLDGHEATIQLRSKGFNIPIIAVTANALNTELERCKTEGFNEFITKPVNAETLRNMIWDCLKTYHNHNAVR